MQKFDREIKEIRDTLVTAYQNWSIWWIYKHEREEFVKGMNKFQSFFHNSIYAHWVTVIISIWCLLDKKNLSLISFYENLKKDNLLSVELILNIESRLKSIELQRKGIQIIRHNVVAHISSKTDYEKTLDLAKLHYQDIKDVIVQLGNIFNLILNELGNNPIAFWENTPEECTRRLLTQLKN